MISMVFLLVLLLNNPQTLQDHFLEASHVDKDEVDYVQVGLLQQKKEVSGLLSLVSSHVVRLVVSC